MEQEPTQQHNQFISSLTDAILQGDDPSPILESEYDHIAFCSICQQKFSMIASIVLGQDELAFQAYAILEEQAQIAEPPDVPQVDLTFLTPKLWKPIEDLNHSVRQLSENTNLIVKVNREEMQAAFKDLSAWLSSSLIMAQAPVRAEGAGQGQTLPLPDPEEDVEIILSVQAAGGDKSHLSIEIHEISSDRLIDRAQISLQNPAGRETAYTKGGIATFIDLDLGQYLIEVKPTEGKMVSQLWRFVITFEEA